MSIRLSVYYCFNNFWQRKIISCVIRSPADYMAEWENVPLDPKKTRSFRSYNRALSLLLALQSQRSADSKAALDDSLTGTHGLLFIDYCFRP